MPPERARALDAYERPNTAATCDRCGLDALCYIEPEPAFDAGKRGERVCARCVRIIGTGRGSVTAPSLDLWNANQTDLWSADQ